MKLLQTTLIDTIRSGHTNKVYLSDFARIERGQGADLGKGHFCARPIILRALLRVILHFEGTMGNNIFSYLKRKQYNYDLNII